ncbi:hypothetical protein [Streptococcus suis]|uniref:hypothetical protein n=1 Tax=Streptococcus suis TaxID=1307 RepID=UPI001E3CFB50|nr:hypothetical protein [Streptococcus suis]MCB2859553.1 hypothetical protein [Streptococcus suis]MCB2868089.1 hypothetical protein [Streptococcus suis]
MNKRIKKKYELENRIRTLETHIDFLIDQNNQLWNIVERNAQATNARFDKIEKQVVNSNTKKPFWKW